MSHETLTACRSTIERAATCTEAVREDASNLRSLLRLSDEELAETLTLEDMADAWLIIPSIERATA